MPSTLHISGTTRLAGVVGYPVSHSLSPIMQNAAFSARRLDAVYLPFAVPPEGLQRFLRAMADLGALGFNITIPHKQRALTIMDEVSPEARRIGAVNTVIIKDGRLIGDNTDGIGFLVSLRQVMSPYGRRAVLLGAGGAARAVAVALADAGVSQLTILARRPAPRRALLEHLRGLGHDPARGLAFDAAAARDAVREADLVINATPLGLQAKDPLPVPSDWLAQKACVMDLVYARGKTRWLKAAARRGCETIPGWRMLLHQGAESFRLWTGRRAPLEVMRLALLGAQWQAGFKESLTLRRR